MAEKAQETTSEVRRLTPDDLDAAVAIDRAIVGDPRRGYFEKRLAAALRQPRAHLQFGIDGPDGLEACVFARVLSGEFGREQESVLLEVINVAPERQGTGAGGRLLAALEAEMRRRDIVELQTSIQWTDHELVRFFAANGFAKAPRHVIQCSVAQADVL
jgi:GNAT superfamily N-acetyltransferase